MLRKCKTGTTCMIRVYCYRSSPLQYNKVDMEISLNECTFSNSTLNSPALWDSLQFESFGTGKMIVQVLAIM